MISFKLEIFIGSDLANTIIRSGQRGMRTLDINCQDVMKMDMPVILEKKQDEIVDSYVKEQMLYRKKIEEAKKTGKTIIKKF